MRLLLDSHVVLWWMGSPERLTPDALAAIADAGNDVFVSAVSVWELNLKVAKGKLDLPKTFIQALRETGFRDLDIAWEHAWAVASLPAVHADPFDRLLVAQALSEGLTLVTHDRDLARYNLPVLAA